MAGRRPTSACARSSRHAPAPPASSQRAPRSPRSWLLCKDQGASSQHLGSGSHVGGSGGGGTAPQSLAQHGAAILACAGTLGKLTMAQAPRRPSRAGRGALGLLAPLGCLAHAAMPTHWVAQARWRAAPTACRLCTERQTWPLNVRPKRWCEALLQYRGLLRIRRNREMPWKRRQWRCRQAAARAAGVAPLQKPEPTAPVSPVLLGEPC